MVCLLEDKPEVQAQLNEYTEILGNADAAYYILSENNGYDLDRAPNGAPSKLFSDLLNYYNGDRKAAIQAKAKVYSESFKNWFGDWLSDDKTNVSKVVDENGEPQIVYHGGPQGIEEFVNPKDLPRKYAGKHSTVLHRLNQMGIYFIDKINVAKEYAEVYRKNKQIYPVFISAKNVKPIKQVQFYGMQWLKNIAKLWNKDFINYQDIKQEDVYKLREQGIDALSTSSWSKSTEFVIFDSNQIKSIDNQGTFSTEDNNIYQNQVEETPESKKVINFYNTFDPEQYTGMTSREFIANVRSYFPSDNTTINRLLDLFNKIDVPIRIVESESLPQGKAYMYYNATTGEITVAIDEFNKCSIGYNATSMLHELVHAFTYSSIESAKKGIGTNLDKAVYDKLSHLYKQYTDLFHSVIQDGEVSGLFYGLKDEYEFVSELLTNSDFYNLLLDFANQRDTGVFNEIRNAILDFFNSIIDLILGREHVNQGTKEIISLKNDLLNLLEYNIQNSNTTSEDQFQRSTRTNANLLFNQTQTVQRYHFDTESELNKRLRDVRNNLAKGLASRLKAVELDESTTYEQKEQIKYQLRNLNDSTLDDLQVIMSFTRELAQDVPVIGRKVLEAYKGNTPALSDDTLVSLSKNYFGFYCNYANTLYNNLSGLDGLPPGRPHVRGTGTAAQGKSRTLAQRRHHVRPRRRGLHAVEHSLSAKADAGRTATLRKPGLQTK